jgi:hypothetical protein
MKKLLTIFGALTLSATPTAALTSVVSCAQPEVAHNYYGKSLVTKEVYQTAYDNWQKYNSTKGEYIFKNVNIGGGINIAQSDMDAFKKTGTFELSPKYQNLIIDRYDTMLEALNLIPFGAGIDYTQFTFANWKVGSGKLMFADSDKTYDVDVTFKETEITTHLQGTFYHKDVATQSDLSREAFENSFTQFNEKGMDTIADPTGTGWFIGLDFSGPKLEDGRFNQPNTTSAEALRQKTLDYTSMLLRSIGLYDITFRPDNVSFDINWQQAIEGVGLDLAGIDGDVITVNSWEGNSAFGTPLKVNFKDSDVAIQVGGSFLPAGVYEWN